MWNFRLHMGVKTSQRKERVKSIGESKPPAPHQSLPTTAFGGQQQRVAIARAVVTKL